MSMRRRRFLTGSTLAAAALAGARRAIPAEMPATEAKAPTTRLRLTPPASGPIRVAFVISNNATMIDFTGPWEVFQDVMVPGRGSSHDEQMPFRLFTVAESGAAVRVTGGMQVVPDHSVDDAPAPNVVVVPAHRSSPRVLDWLKRVSRDADLVMSVCTGAFALARAGLLDGRDATTHHDFFDEFARSFPAVRLKRGLRFVESERIATAGGLTSGIDLTLRVVERYFGRETAQRTADYMEYQSRGWVVG